MITTEQHGVIAIAREHLGLVNEEPWTKYLREHTGCDTVVDLTPRTFQLLTDRFIVDGFQDPEYVTVIEPDYVRLIRQWASEFGLDEDLFTAVSRAADAPGPDRYDGHAFRRMFRFFAFLGADHQALARNALSPKQLALLHAAKRELLLDKNEEYFRHLLIEVGGALNVSGLSVRGYDRVLSYFCAKLGWQRPAKPEPAKRPSYGRRPGMASPPQVKLIRELWAEWSGADDEDALSAWLEKYHHVSSLRFLTSAAAAKVITGLKAMKRRRHEAGEDAA